MDFDALFKKISPRLKRIARRLNGHGCFIDEDDLYQEMCLHLWNKYRDGMTAGINCAYVVKGCEFHVLNYIRKEREHVAIVSLETPLDDEGYTLEDVLPDARESLDAYVERRIIIGDIEKNGMTPREKEVFSHLLRGYTVREAAEKLGISHVRVVKIKRKIIEKWQRKKNKGYQKGKLFTSTK